LILLSRQDKKADDPSCSLSGPATVRGRFTADLL